MLHKTPHICFITVAGRMNSIEVEHGAYTGSRFPQGLYIQLFRWWSEGSSVIVVVVLFVCLFFLAGRGILMIRRWREVLSRGGVRGDTP